MGEEIVLYSASMCGDCQKLKEYMDRHGIEYELRDIRECHSSAQKVQDHTGKLGVPYLVIDGNWVRGYPLEGPFTDEFAAGLFAK